MTTPIKAITIKQPWAFLVASGHKDVENRSRRTHHRGLIAIHAGLRAARDAVIPTDEGHAAILDAVERRALAFGAVIAVAEITDSHSLDCPGDRGACSPWAIRGMWHWRLTNVRPLSAPISARGALGLWTLPDYVQAAVTEQLAATAR